MKPIPAAAPAAPDNRSEAVLLAQAALKDETAIRELVRRCNQQVFRVARGILHDDAEAEDAVQAAYVAAFTKLGTFQGNSSFATWLTRIVMNEAFGRRRRRQRVVSLDDYRMDLAASSEGDNTIMFTPAPPSPESEYGRTEVRAFLERAIDALPEPFRLTYVLREVQEMSTRDVADLLGISAITVKTRLLRARRRLREDFRKNLAGEFSAVFPFDGARCAGMGDRVILALRQPASA